MHCAACITDCLTGALIAQNVGAEVALNRLPGGAAAVKEPCRAALGLLFAMQGDAIFEQSDLPPVAAFSTCQAANSCPAFARAGFKNIDF
jgi:hydrogenase maturation factor HypF (carbamoyltransferase family)